MARKSYTGTSLRRESLVAANSGTDVEPDVSGNASTISGHGSYKSIFTGRAAKSCNLCRKMKQKCDAVERFPESCSRCDRRNVQCEFDGSRVRNSWLPSKSTNLSANTSKSGAEAAAAIMMLMNGYAVRENENGDGVAGGGGGGATTKDPQAADNYSVKNTLKSSCSDEWTHGMNSRPTYGITNGSGRAHNTPEVTNDRRQQLVPSLYPTDPNIDFRRVLPFDKSEEELPDWVTWEQLETMYFHYMDKCHPYFPVVPNELLVPGSVLFASHRLLFWAFTCIGCAVEHAHLSDKIFDHTSSLINSRPGTSYIFPSEDLAHIAAMMVISYWPNHESIRRAQISIPWGYAGYSCHLAVSLGVNCPSKGSEYAWVGHDSHLRALIWIGCLVNVQSQAMLNGFPSTISNTWASIDKDFGSVVTESCKKDGSVPEFASSSNITEFIKQSRLLAIYTRAASAFCENPDQPLGLIAPEARGSIYRSFSAELSSTIADMSPMSPMTQLFGLCCKFYMHCLLLLPGTPEHDTQSVIIPVYVVSIQLTKTVTDMVASGVHYLSFPLVIIRTIIFSTMLIYKILSTPYKSVLDDGAALDSIRGTYHFVMEYLSMFGLSPPSTLVYNTNDPGAKRKCWLATLMFCVQKMYTSQQISPTICHTSTRRGAGPYYSMVQEIVYWRYSNKLVPPKIIEYLSEAKKGVYLPGSDDCPIPSQDYEGNTDEYNTDVGADSRFPNTSGNSLTAPTQENESIDVQPSSADVRARTLFADEFWRQDPDFSAFLKSSLWD